MAPKAASKRAAAKAPASPPSSKKRRVSPDLRGICDAVQRAVGLPVATRNMFLACIPHAFATGAEARHEVQTRVINMLGEIIEGVVAKMKEDVALEAEKAKGVEERMAELREDVEAAEVKAREAEAVVAGKKEELAAFARATEAAKAALQEKLDIQRTSDAAILKAQQDKVIIEAVVAKNLAPILEGQAENPTVHYRALLPYIEGLDESLMSALPSSCSKRAADRGSFDTMVLGQLSSYFKDRQAALAKAAQVAEPAAQERAAAVEAARRAVDEASAAQRAAADAVMAAKTEGQAAAAAVQAAKDRVAAFDSEHAAATRERLSRAEELERFLKQTVEQFEVLRDGPSAAVAGGA